MTCPVTLFSFENKSVRIITDEHGEVWFVGKDLCDVLGYARPNDAMQLHCRGAVNYRPIPDSIGRIQETRILSEADMLRLIVRSRLPAAVEFERMVFEEILPSVRKTGSYSMRNPGQPSPFAGGLQVPASFSEALRLAANLHDENERAKARLSLAEPKAAALDLLTENHGRFSLTCAAKTLKVAPRRFFQFLLDNKWVYRTHYSGDMIAMQDKLSRGLLEHKIVRPGGVDVLRSQVVVTPKGMTHLGTMLAAFSME